jgi:carbamoyl-phosphate synthase small subunit
MAKTYSIPVGATGLLALADGAILFGQGLGKVGSAVGEVCFNTAITGYQEILTDPSYAAQIVAFTFPHIGNVGANDEDIEASSPAAHAAARGAILRAGPTAPSNWRAAESYSAWLAKRGVVGLAGIDTRALTAHIRENGMLNAVIAHHPEGRFDIEALLAQAAQWPGLVGLDLAREVTTAQRYTVAERRWTWEHGVTPVPEPKYRVALIDYGVKRNILRALGDVGCEVTVLPAETAAEDILAMRPDGVVLSNGPGDPAATGAYACPTIKTLADSGVPMMGICLGHQMLAIALGAKTLKMPQGHHGANHPVKDVETGKVEIVSMNHGFAVDRASLPAGVNETHISLFDGSNCGIAVAGKPIFSIQHHPEASPGPQDSHYLFARFATMMQAHANEAKGGDHGG